MSARLDQHTKERHRWLAEMRRNERRLDAWRDKVTLGQLAQVIRGERPWAV